MTETPGDPEVSDPVPTRPPLDLAQALRSAGWRDALCLGGILASVALGLGSYPIAAFLLSHVKTHLLVTASLSALLTAGAAVFDHRENLIVVAVLATVGLTKFGPFFFWAGRRYGDDLEQFLEEHSGIRPKTVARTERWVGRFGPLLLTASYFLPVPATLVMVLLGASGVSWLAFAIADLIGAVAWVAVFLAVGHHFHSQVDHIAHVVNQYSLRIGIALFVVLFVVAFVRARRQLASQA